MSEKKEHSGGKELSEGEIGVGICSRGEGRRR